MAITSNEQIKTNETRVDPDKAVSSEDPQVIRAQIETTRAEMGRTMDEIQVRLSPDYIKQQTQETIREAAMQKVENMTQSAEYKVNNWRSGAVRKVKENPIPAALIGIGLGWMLMSDSNGYDDDSEYERRRRGPYSYVSQDYGPYKYYEDDPGFMSQMQDMTGNAQEWVADKRESAQRHMYDVKDSVQNFASSTSESVRENVGQVRDHAQDTASNTAEQVQLRADEARMRAQRAADEARFRARLQTRRAKRSFWQTMEDNPLAIGIAAAAAGALVGLVIPSTEKENEMMGETRDRLVDEATQTAKEALRKSQTVVQRAAETAVERGKT